MSRDIYQSDWDCFCSGKPGYGAANCFENSNCNNICKTFHSRGHVEATSSVRKPPRGGGGSGGLRSNNGDRVSYIMESSDNVVAASKRNADGEPLQKQIRTYVI